MNFPNFSMLDQKLLSDVWAHTIQLQARFHCRAASWHLWEIRKISEIKCSLASQMEPDPGNYRSPRQPPLGSCGLFPPFSTDWLLSASLWLLHMPNHAFGFHSPWLSSANISDSAVQCTTSKFVREEADGTRWMLVPVLVQLSWVREVVLACPFWNPQQHVYQLLSLFIITLLWSTSWHVVSVHGVSTMYLSGMILNTDDPKKKSKTWSLSSCTHDAVGEAGLNRSLWYSVMWALLEGCRVLWEAHRMPFQKPLLTLQRFSGFSQTLVTLPYSASLTVKHTEMSQISIHN